MARPALRELGLGRRRTTRLAEADLVRGRFSGLAVFGATIRTALDGPGAEPGVTPDVTALDQEGFPKSSRAR